MALTASLVAVALSACSGAPPRRVSFDTPKPEAAHKRFARALRLAASGRVQARAGLHDEAAESLRLSYRIHPDLGTLTDHAEAAERAGHYGQAHAAWREMLNHKLDAPTRKKAKAEAERLAPLVPADHMPVLITVSPDHATVTLERTMDGYRRVVRSDGVLWLKAGAWQAATVATGYKRELSAFRVGRRRAQSFAVVLERGAAAVRMAGRDAAPRPGESTYVEKPKAADPAGKTADPGEKTDPKATAQTGTTPGEGAGAAAGADPATSDPTATGPVDGGVQKPQPRGGSALSTWGPIATAGLGVVALGVGGYFGLNASQNADVANGLSPTRPDYKTQLKFYSDAATDRAQLANTLFIAGGALAAAGTVWWFLAPRSSDVAASHPLRPSGMTLTGRGFVALWTF